VIFGSFWLGAALGAGASLVLLDPTLLPPDLGWRAAFFIGAVLGLIILVMRGSIPESPRWLAIHGRPEEAQAILDAIEDGHRCDGHYLPDEELAKFRCRARDHTLLREVWRALFVTYWRRTLVGLCLMASQAFFYNAIFFTYALVLTAFYGIRSDQVGWYILPFAVGNFLGPLFLGRLFDTLGRRVMIASTYAVSGLLLALTGYLFAAGALSATEQTIAWTVIFFFASAAASSAYLTVSETFPLEVRALAIAFFYAVGTGIGGVGAPWLFGVLIDTGSRSSLFAGYLLGASLMVAAAIVVFKFGVDAERKSLETVATPLSAMD
jgi:MFS family permease